MPDRPVLFAGPSAAGILPRQLAGLNCLPPVRRGDIDRLVARQATDEPGVIIVCDGVFGSEPAVSHAELCQALDRGWQVWGTSSMGAIRACELRHEGMRGWGWVYEQFRRRPDFGDDEPALMHWPIPPYTPVTLALVNVRHALLTEGTTLGIPVRAGRQLVAWLHERWFADRTPELLLDLMTGPLRLPGGTALGLLDAVLNRPVKRTDLLTLLRARPWRSFATDTIRT